MRLLGLAAVGVLVLAIGGILLMSAGIFDPIPATLPTAPLPLSPMTLTTTEPRLVWLAEADPSAPLDARLTVAGNAGSPDVAYALLLGNPVTFLAVILSPAGYTSISLHEKGRQIDILPAQTWPHIHPGSELNEIQFTRQDQTITVRLNRETLWSGRVPLTETCLGISGQTFAPPTTIDFISLQFAP